MLADTRVNDGWPAYETHTQEEQSSACRLFYEGVNHGFLQYYTALR
jgi:hypothetical protein